MAYKLEQSEYIPKLTWENIYMAKLGVLDKESSKMP